jgi:hypothetical protein
LVPAELHHLILNFIPGPVGKTWPEDYLSPKRLNMSESPFRHVSTEALQKKEKQLILITRLLGGCITLHICLSAFIYEGFGLDRITHLLSADFDH